MNVGVSTRRRNVPDRQQVGMRRRLRMMRISKQISQNELDTVASPGIISRWETHDISTMKIGHLFRLAEAFNEDPSAFARYLFGEADELAPVANDNVTRMSVLLRSLSDEDQAMVLDVVRAIVKGRVDGTVHTGQLTPKSRRPDARSILTAAIADS